MDYGKIACFDVYYYEAYAQACGIVFQTMPVERIISKHCVKVKTFDDYVPGEFYKRELPPLLEVYAQIKEEVNLVIIDGYVLLAGGKKGLGGYLYESLGRRIPVIGVAKTHFSGVNCMRIYRGNSMRPLYISSMGIEPDLAAKLIANLQGAHRIPEMLKAVDRLSRSSSLQNGTGQESFLQ